MSSPLSGSPPPGFTPGFTTAHRAHAGGREVNEDSADHALAEGAGCWVVADGLGGHGRGDLASSAAVRRVLERFREAPGRVRENVAGLVEAAHGAVRQAQREASFPGMRTTLAVLVANGTQAVWAHVGDTRVYHFREGLVARQTLDHSVPQMLVGAGEITAEEIRTHPDRSRLLRALGEEEEPRADTGGPEPLQDGDAFLLCSDGWWEHMTEREMELDLAKAESPDAWLDQMADRILMRAVGAFDNLTALGVFVGTRA